MTQVLQNLPDAVAVIDAGGLVVYANHSFLSLIRAGEVSVTGRPALDLLPGLDLSHVLGVGDRPRDPGLIRRSGVLRRLDGTVREVDVVLGLVGSQSGSGASAADLVVATVREAKPAGPAAGDVGPSDGGFRPGRMAHDLQRLLLPEQLPNFDGFDLCVRYVASAPGAAAGGDFYDVVTLPSNRMGLSIGDVEGHDTVAAATMGQLRSASRALAGQVREPGALVDALRWSWPLLGFERTATALFARIDQTSGEVTMASAGHFPPAVVDAGGRASYVDMEVSPLLGAPGITARSATIFLEPGEMLFLFTDGLIEERHIGLDQALHRLLDVLESSSAPLLDDVCEKVIDDFGRLQGGPDDVALMAVRRRRKPTGEDA